MKTPDEIKKGLEACGSDECHGKHTDCPYEGDLFCLIHVCGDARVYIHRLENHIGELTEKVAQIEAAQPKWISVEDRLPIDCTGVLVFIRIGCTSSTSISHVLKRRWWSRGIPIENVTHWMPLPEPPKEE